MNVELPGLRRVREARVLTQKQLMARSGVGFVTISRIENSDPDRPYLVRPTNAHRLARALRVEPDELMSAEGTGVPLAPLHSVQQKATELLMILERDSLEAEQKDNDELRASVFKTALQAWRSLQRQRLRGEDVPPSMEEDYAAFIEPFIERMERMERAERNIRAEQLLRELREPVEA